MKLLLYCTKAKPYLFESINEKGKYMLENDEWFKELNGKIVAECDFEVEEIYNFFDEIDGDFEYWTKNLSEEDLLKRSCTTKYEILDYINNLIGYAIHIKNLHIFDKPRELSDCKHTFVHCNNYCDNNFIKSFCKDVCSHNMDGERLNVWCDRDDKFGESLSKAPQNMMCCSLDEERKVLISIKPEWLCKILNGEKTIEVRKKVLKEMLK